MSPVRSALTLTLALAAICAPAGSAATAAAATPLTPSATAAPALTGTPSVGETLRCSTGSWTNDPASFTYAWLRDGVPIGGRGDDSYVTQAADEGHSIACEVTAEVRGDEYEITGLPSESYRVSFSPASGVNYLSQCFSGRSCAEATPVAVTAPSVVPGIDASLAVGGEITGRVTSELGTPLAGIEVCIGFLSCRHTDANGEYTFTGLPAGSYKVLFNGEALDPVCYEAACEEYEAQYDEVTVTPPSTSAGVDAVLKSRSIPSGSITGTVGGAKAGILVCAHLYEGLSPYYCEATDDSGEYTISNVPVGQYAVGFYPEGQNYIATYYKGTSELNTATEVSVIAGAATTVDETLEQGGEVTGEVTSKSGEPLAGVEVCPRLSVIAYCAQTDEQGDYALVGLPTRSDQEIYFKRNEAKAYLSPANPEVVEVTAGGSTSVPNVELEEGGSIRGRVTTDDGGAFAGGEVCASEPNLPSLYRGTRCAVTNADGDYAIVGLAEATSYKVVFHGEQCGGAGCVQDYLGETYAQPVSVEVATPTSGIDAELTEGGKITGAITAIGGGALSGVVNVCTSPTGANSAYEPSELRRCAQAHAGSGSASARSNALTISGAPGREHKVPPRGHFKLVRKRFDAKAGKLDLFFRVVAAGSLSWKLRFTSAGGPQRKHRKAKGSFGKGSRRVEAGPVEIKVKPTAKAIKVLRSGKLLRVKGKADFKPASGNGTETVRVNAHVRQARRRRGRHRRP